MTELRETVARAIAAARSWQTCQLTVGDWDDRTEGEREPFLDLADAAIAAIHSQGDGLREACGCPVHHRPDCEHRPRIPTHAYRPHPKWPWFCKDCGYPENERLKHHPSALAAKGGHPHA